MKYACLIYLDEDAPAAQQALEKLLEGLRAAGKAGSAAVLEPSASATSLRRRGGAASVVTGPAGCGRELLAALVVIDAQDLDASLASAARLSSSPLDIEVRPVKGRARCGPRRMTLGKIVPLQARD